MRDRVLHVHRPGCVPYGEALAAQRRLAARTVSARFEGHLLLLEHPPTFTLGRNADRANILAAADELARRGIAVESTDRGGDVTWHGPGQVVGYLVLHLPTWRHTVTSFVHGLEDVMVRACARFGVAARAGREPIGAWAGERKIGSIGIHVSRGITTHGLALNACPDLSHFDLINPCGLRGCPMTSLAREGAAGATWERAAAACEEEVRAWLEPDRVEAARP